LNIHQLTSHFKGTLCASPEGSRVNWQQKLNPYLATYWISISTQYIDIH